RPQVLDDDEHSPFPVPLDALHLEQSLFRVVNHIPEELGNGPDNAGLIQFIEPPLTGHFPQLAKGGYDIPFVFDAEISSHSLSLHQAAEHPSGFASHRFLIQMLNPK